MEDREIVDLFFQRSEDAIVQLKTKYGSLMQRVAYHLLQNAEDAMECVNDACLGTWNAIPPARPAVLSAYVCRITKNQALNRLRYHGAKKRSIALEQSLQELEEMEGALPSAKTVEERCVQWLRLLNEYKAQVTKKVAHNWDFSLSLSFPGTGIGEGNRPEDFYVYQWKGYVIPRLNCQTGILASSKYKREAFQFLRLIRSDASYAKLLLYGKEYLDGTGESRYSFANQLIFGLDTGLTSGRREDGLRHFSSANEKKAYYKEWILASPALSLQNPEVCDEMNVVRDYREQLIYAEDFDEMLKEAKSKTRDPMQKILKELKYWDE